MDLTLKPGTLVAGRFRVKGLIAEGGMGAVHDATDERLGRPVAIKVLLPELVSDRGLVARFEREALAAARLSHPGIVQVHDFGTTDAGLCYLVMERLTGSTLAQLLSREGKLAPARATDIAEQALAALASAHAAGIVHRDLKPANLMVLPTGGTRELVKVLDFGIAQIRSGEAYDRLTRTGAILGTPAFMAPEQASGRAVDARTDLYAMGVVLFCLLTGRRPFEGDAGEVLRKVLGEASPRVSALAPEVPEALASIVHRAMQKEPGDRYADANEMASALAAWRTSHGAALQPPTSIDATVHASSDGEREARGAAALTVSDRPREIAGATATTLPDATAVLPRRPSRLRRSAPWLIFLGLVGSCVLGVAVLGAVATFWPRQGGPDLSPVAGARPRWAPTVPSFASESGDCALAADCCDAYATATGGTTDCASIRDLPEDPGSHCLETLERYRSSLVAVGGDPSVCDP